MPRKNPSSSADQFARDHNRRTSLPPVAPDYLGRHEMLALVPLSMSSIDTLEKKGKFPSRFVLSPTVKVCWRRREVEKWLAERARKRVHTAQRLPDAGQDRTIVCSPAPHLIATRPTKRPPRRDQSARRRSTGSG